MDTSKYGDGDRSYMAAGELEGITRLVDAFYDNMERLPIARAIRQMHPMDLGESRRRLAFFLSGWLGGPRLYQEHYGGISIPNFHRHLPIGDSEKEAWLLCMQEAIAEQPYQDTFKKYLIEQLRVPAERIQWAAEAKPR
tara:strand:- start:1111 stop:1527 length:417 start_codon:yes stop_codon:yes gene_type:complete